MKTISLLTTAALVSLITLTVKPLPSMATENNISTVSITASSTEPSTLADYTVNFDIAFGAGAAAIRLYPISGDGAIGSSTASGFSFASTTVASSQFTATANSVGGDTELAIGFGETVTTGDYMMTLGDVLNSATVGTYKLGMSTTMSPTDSDFILSDAFTIAVDPCLDITAADYTDARVRMFGTNAQVTRALVDDASSYTVQYATGEADITADAGTTETFSSDAQLIISDLTARTTYYVQVEALNTDGCTIATKTFAKDSERQLSNQNYTKPTVNRIGATSARVHWVEDTETTTYDLQLWKGSRKLKQHNNVSALRKDLTNTYLNPGQTYKVRVRADYSTGETSGWSEFKRFTTN